MGIVSLVLVGTECFIMGLDAMKVKGPEDMKTLLISHLRAVRSHPRLRNAWCIFIPENNLGMEAAHMAHMLKGRTPCLHAQREEPRGSGMTTNKRKDSLRAGLLGVSVWNAHKPKVRVREPTAGRKRASAFDQERIPNAAA